jgi:hypothetical protein
VIFSRLKKAKGILLAAAMRHKSRGNRPLKSAPKVIAYTAKVQMLL